MKSNLRSLLSASAISCLHGESAQAAGLRGGMRLRQRGAGGGAPAHVAAGRVGGHRRTRAVGRGAAIHARQSRHDADGGRRTVGSPHSCGLAACGWHGSFAARRWAGGHAVAADRYRGSAEGTARPCRDARYVLRGTCARHQRTERASGDARPGSERRSIAVALGGIVARAVAGGAAAGTRREPARRRVADGLRGGARAARGTGRTDPGRCPADAAVDVAAGRIDRDAARVSARPNRGDGWTLRESAERLARRPDRCAARCAPAPGTG